MYKAVSRIDSNNPHCNPMTIILSFQMRKLRHREVEWLAQGRMSCQPLADLEGWLMTFEPATGLPFCLLFWGWCPLASGTKRIYFFAHSGTQVEWAEGGMQVAMATDYLVHSWWALGAEVLLLAERRVGLAWGNVWGTRCTGRIWKNTRWVDQAGDSGECWELPEAGGRGGKTLTMVPAFTKPTSMWPRLALRGPLLICFLLQIPGFSPCLWSFLQPCITVLPPKAIRDGALFPPLPPPQAFAAEGWEPPFPGCSMRASAFPPNPWSCLLPRVSGQGWTEWASHLSVVCCRPWPSWPGMKSCGE